MQTSELSGDPQDKHDEPVAAPPDDPATKLQRKLTPRLDPDDEAALADRVLTDFNQAIQDRAEWETRLAEWEDQYYNRTPDEKMFPWPGASNFHVPITMMHVETYKPRLVEAVMGEKDPVIVIATTQAGEERKQKVETVLNWQIKSKMRIEPIVAQSAHLFLQPGLAVAKTYWKVDRRWRKFLREFPLGTGLPQIFEALFGESKPRNLRSEGEGKFYGEIRTSPQGGAPLECYLTLNVLEDGLQVMVEREEVVEGPQVDLIDPIDLIVPVKGGHEIDELPWCQHRMWMNEDDLRRKALSGRFYADVVEEILTTGAPRGDQPALDSGRYRQSQDDAEGVEGQGPSNVRRTQWDVLEDYRRYDIDGDGLDEEVIVWASPHAPNRVLGWDYLDNVYAHGRRPIRVGRFFPVPFRFYGLSYAEMIKGVQDEINAIHNQKVDYATIQNMPMGFKRASATIPPIQQLLRPGNFIDVDNPQQDIFIPKWQGSPAWGAQEEATLLQYGERLGGITDLSLGRQPNRVGATRTAKGTQTLLSEAGLRFKIAMQAFQRLWVGIFSDVLALDQEYLPPGQEFRVTGKRPSVIRLKDRTELRGAYDLRLAPTTDTLNREQMRQDATVLMQAVMNPTAIQAGVIAKKGIRRAYEDLLKAYGKDPEFYMEPDASPKGPVEELMMFAVGQYVSPVMGENIDMHIKAHTEALQDPAVPREVKQLLQRHLQETVQLKQAQQLAQTMQGANGGQRPPVGQQAQNAQTGRQPQPMNPGGQTSPQGGMTQAPGGQQAGGY